MKKYEKIRNWYIGQKENKWLILYKTSDKHLENFHLRDLKNKITVGVFDDWYDAAEFAYDLVHDQLVIPE